MIIPITFPLTLTTFVRPFADAYLGNNPAYGNGLTLEAVTFSGCNCIYTSGDNNYTPSIGYFVVGI